MPLRSAVVLPFAPRARRGVPRGLYWLGALGLSLCMWWGFAQGCAYLLSRFG